MKDYQTKARLGRDSKRPESQKKKTDTKEYDDVDDTDDSDTGTYIIDTEGDNSISKVRIRYFKNRLIVL